MDAFDLPAALRRVRRRADASQRQLAERAGTSKSAVAAAESGARGLDVRVFARAAAAAGLRLALLDVDGDEVLGMDGDAVRDMSGRRFPAHLDTRYSDERWWHGPERYSRRQPWYTFDRDREVRDAWRRRTGTPDDHQLPQHGDSPAARGAARRRRAMDARDAEWERRFLAGELPPVDLDLRCDCPPACEELDDWSGKPVHAEDCLCLCDVS